MISLIKRINVNVVAVLLCLIGGLFVVYAFTGQWPFLKNPYNSYALQADSWLQGQLALINGESYEWLELAIYDSEYFVSFPPFPSYILLPFASFMGTLTPDHWIAVISFLLAGVYSVRLFHAMNGPKEYAVFYSIFLLLASNAIFTSVNGWVWFIAQNFAFTLSLMSIYYAKRKKGGLSFALWACAVGCRPMQALYFPILCYILITELKKEEPELTILNIIKKKWTCAIPTSLIALSYMILNYCRFGSIVEFGHNYLPEFMREEEGQFSISYISKNISNMLRLPGYDAETNRLDFYWSEGFSLFLVSPIFIAFFIAIAMAIYKKKNLLLSLMILVILTAHVIFIAAHRTLGGSHFGNRYLNDLLPFVYYGLLYYLPEKRWFRLCCYPLCVVGITLNFVGTILYYIKS